MCLLSEDIFTHELNCQVLEKDDWYGYLRKSVKLEYQKESLKNGTELKSQAEPMSVEDLESICGALFNLNVFKDRALLCIQYQCLGRVSKVVVLNLSSLKWNSSLRISDCRLE